MAVNSSKAHEFLRIWRRFCEHKLALVGLFIVLIFILSAVFAPLLAPYSPYEIGSGFESAPSGKHILGTDQIGRDVLSRLIYGARVSLSVGIGTTLVTTFLGVLLGLHSGYFGGTVDIIIMRAAEVLMSFPTLILIMVVSSVIGPGLDRIIIIMGILGWPAAARLVRGNVLSIKEMDYTKSAVASGFRTQRILFFHVLPNIFSSILVQATFNIARFIIMESGLSFLGMGVNPPTASWGNMLTDAQSLTTLTEKPWLWIPPGFMIFLSVLAFNFVGDGLRDALDPKLAN
ncbi:MAG: ABC transporter permease [Spirochaetaceae bacterium]|jgi:peptide/nickel transport system permease protein|nr:ABC transporter permease [Spirochaetaceae bacterium]